MVFEFCCFDNEFIKKIDIYVIGILFYEMLIGKYLIEGKKVDEILIL